MTEPSPRIEFICQLPAGGSTSRALASVASPTEHLRPLVSPRRRQVMAGGIDSMAPGKKKEKDRGYFSVECYLAERRARLCCESQHAGAGMLLGGQVKGQNRERSLNGVGLVRDKTKTQKYKDLFSFLAL